MALRVYVAFAVLRGYGPARAFLSVVAGLIVIGVLLNGFDPFAGLSIASIVAGIVLVWLPVSNRYFAAVTAARKARPKVIA